MATPVLGGSRASGQVEGGIEVEGLRDFARALRQLEDKGVIKDMKAASKEAADIVVAEAQSRAKRMPGKIGDIVARDIASVAVTTGAVVRVGSKKKAPVSGKKRAKPVKFADLAWALEFGAKHDIVRIHKGRTYADTPRNRKRNRVGSAVPVRGGLDWAPKWRGNQYEKPVDSPGVGYYLHPAIRDKAPEVLATFEERINRLAAQAFPDD